MNMIMSTITHREAYPFKYVISAFWEGQEGSFRALDFFGIVYRLMLDAMGR